MRYLKSNGLIVICLLMMLFQLTLQAAIAQTDQAKLMEASKLYLSGSDAFSRGDFNVGLQMCEKGLQLVEGQKVPLRTGLYSLRAGILARLGKQDLAEKSSQEAMKSAQMLDGKPNGPFYGLAIINRAQMLNHSGKFAAAEPYAIQGTQIMEMTAQKDKSYEREVAEALGEKMKSFAGQQKEKETLDVLRKLLPLKGKANPTDFDLYMGLASITAQSGDIYYREGNVKNAESLYKRSIDLYNEWNTKSVNNNIGTTHVLPYDSIINAMKNLIEIYNKAGKTAEAKKLSEEFDFYNGMKQSSLFNKH